MAEINHFKDLIHRINKLDGQLYKKYRQLEGIWTNTTWSLLFIKAQADTHAPPSHMALRVSHLYSDFPVNLISDAEKKCALADFILRAFDRIIKKISRHTGSGKSGNFYCDEFGPEIINRSSVAINSEYVELRFRFGLPGKGNRIFSSPLLSAIEHSIPKIAEQILNFSNLDQDKLKEHITLHTDQNNLRNLLDSYKAAAFIPDGAVIPREDSFSLLPLKNAHPFKAPEHLRTKIELQSGMQISGMFIPRGVTVITGGGFHGKSTILSGIKMGIYNHIKGDGREYLVADSATAKISAEDGRIARGINISPYINNLPFEKSSEMFSSLQCSGSTSQAASVIEALRINTRCLLFDEDTCATNFLFCDEPMMKLIGNKDKTINSFLSSARSLFSKTGVSTILVSGSFSQSFKVADQIYKISSFSLEDVTAQAQDIMHKESFTENSFKTEAVRAPRIIKGKNFKIKKRIKPFKTKVLSSKSIEVGKMKINFYSNDQIISPGQAHLIEKLLLIFEEKLGNSNQNMESLINDIFKDLPHLTELTNRSGLSEIRPYDFAFALNRLKMLSVK